MNSDGEDGENNRLTVDYSVVLANIMNNVDKIYSSNMVYFSLKSPVINW